MKIDNIGSGEITASTGSVVAAFAMSPSRGANRGIGAADEVIYAYKGTAESPTFLTAIASGGFTNLNGLLTNTGLAVGVNAIDLSTLDDDCDTGAYVGTRSGKVTFAEYQALINDPSNWVAQDGPGDQSMDTTSPDIPFSNEIFSTSCEV